MPHAKNPHHWCGFFLGVGDSECDDNDDNQVDDFSQDDDQSTVDNVGSGYESDDRSDDGSPHTSNDFCQLDIWSAINNWYGGKTGKQKLNFILNRLFKLTLLSRAMSRDDSCESIIQTAEHFQDTFIRIRIKEFFKVVLSITIPIVIVLRRALKCKE